MNKDGTLTEQEVLQRINFDTNVEIVSSLLVALEKKHKRNKKITNVIKSFREMCVYTWSLQVDVRELTHKASNIKNELNLMKEEFYKYEPINKHQIFKSKKNDN